ncbi:MAG: hypothetical protein IJG80_04735 [Selenomonadaceae bacterium]|nr:hypothetical protein [Selenomonadaceae bacterium]MBQ3725725.1 hypothetical protein [Selenomonadaceae bacterium]MBQ9496229.1 hypothetical protein [Selenomonadaceae bacterium]
MTDVEKEIDRKLAKIDMKLKEIRDIRVAMRDSQRRHDEERRCSHESELEEDRKRHETYMREIFANIDDKFDKLSSQLKMMTLTTILFSGLITWMILAVLK